MGRAFAGDDADLAAAVAVEHRTAEDLFQQFAILGLQHLGRGDDGMRPIGFQPAGLEEAGEQHDGRGVGLDDARPEAVQAPWNSAMRFFGETAGVQPQRLAQKGAAQRATASRRRAGRAARPR